MSETGASQAARKVCFVRGAPDHVGAAPKERSALPLGSGREAFEAAIRLRRDQPDGIG